MSRVLHVSATVLLASLAGCSADGGRADGGGDPDRSCDQAAADGGTPAVPGWDDRVGPWVRQMRLQTPDSASPFPVAWSMINQACQNRALVLELALLLASDPTRPPLLLKESDLTDGFLRAALAAPALEVGTLSVTGPLMVQQSLFVPGATACTMKPWSWYWAYHSVPAVKVNGQWMVFDLSVGDRPVAIDAWLKNVVAAPVECQLSDQATYTEVWSYWNVVLGTAWDPPTQRPVPPCAYIVTPALTLRADAASDALFAVVRESPTALVSQTEGFRTLMGNAQLPSLTDEQLARVTTRYEPMTEKTFCARPEFEARYCATVK